MQLIAKTILASSKQNQEIILNHQIRKNDNFHQNRRKASRQKINFKRRKASTNQKTFETTNKSIKDDHNNQQSQITS
jgi:hypothetical protein